MEDQQQPRQQPRQQPQRRRQQRREQQDWEEGDEEEDLCDDAAGGDGDWLPAAVDKGVEQRQRRRQQQEEEDEEEGLWDGADGGDEGWLPDVGHDGVGRRRRQQQRQQQEEGEEEEEGDDEEEVEEEEEEEALWDDGMDTSEADAAHEWSRDSMQQETDGTSVDNARPDAYEYAFDSTDASQEQQQQAHGRKQGAQQGRQRRMRHQGHEQRQLTPELRRLSARKPRKQRLGQQEAPSLERALAFAATLAAGTASKVRQNLSCISTVWQVTVHCSPCAGVNACQLLLS